MTGAYLLALKRYHADCRLSQQLLHSIAQPQSKLWQPPALNEGIASVLNNRINRRRKDNTMTKVHRDWETSG